jgi:hypothetical protein
MPPPVPFRVVGANETAAQFDQAAAQRAATIYPPNKTPSLTGLNGYIWDQWMIMRRHRDTASSGWSYRLLRALRAFNGEYEPEQIIAIKKFGGSEVYARLLAMKCRGTTSLLRDVYLGPERPWGLEPDDDPPIPDEIIQSIQTLVHSELQEATQAHYQSLMQTAAHYHAVSQAHAYGQQTGQSAQQVQSTLPPEPPPPPPIPDANAIRDRILGLEAAAREAAKKKCAQQTQIAEDKIQEILNEGGFYTALAEFLVDLPLFPYAVIKGPVVRIKTSVEWIQTPSQSPPALSRAPPNPSSPDFHQQNRMGAPGQTAPRVAGPKQAVVTNKPILCWERVSPFDIYWTPGVSDIANANVIERMRLTRAELNDLLDMPGFNTDEVRAVLDEYGSGGLVDTWDQTDQPRAILESREDPRFNQSGIISCLQFQGNVQGKHLLDIGFDPRQITDPSRDYHIQAWLIGTHIIKAQLTPSPRKRHQYYVTSLEKVPGTPVGNGLPDILTDITTVANATLRSLVNNLSIASGPQVIVNDDRLSDGEDGEDLYPWKRWHVKSDPFGNNTEPAISFFNPASNAQELLAVYQAFSQLADEISAIPKFMTGTPSAGVGRTASGLSMLMQNSAKILQTVCSNIDRDVIGEVLDGLFDMIMLFDKSGILTGDEKAKTLGVASAIQRETERSRQLEFLQLTANPIDMQIIGPKGRAQVLRSVAEKIGLPGEDIVPSDEALAAQQKVAAAMAAQQGIPGHAQSPPEQPSPGAQAQGQQAGPPANNQQGPMTNNVGAVAGGVG